MTDGFGKGHHLHLIDGSAFIFRAYHALPPLTRRSDGLPIGAVAGFCNMVWKYLQDGKGSDQPTHAAVIFDHSARTFRNDIYPLYKANRPEPPEDLRPQFPLTREATRASTSPASRPRASRPTTSSPRWPARRGMRAGGSPSSVRTRI